jgi:K+-sensing histidine kinase KdpD
VASPFNGGFLAALASMAYDFPNRVMASSSKDFESAVRDARDAIAAVETTNDSDARTKTRLLEAIDHAREGTEPSEAERWAFLGALTHDLRDPLAAVVMGATFLAKPTGMTDAVRAKRMVDAILRSAARMTSLVRNCSDFVHVVAGRLRLDFPENDANEILDLAIARREEFATERKVTIRRKNAPDRTTIDCNQEHIVIAISHILANAIRYSPIDHEVTIASNATDSRVAFVIHDHGPGMSAERLAHYFDRYWHAGQKARDGTGLGIAIAKGIVDAHGGVMSIETGSPSTNGTTVTIALPRTRAAQI